MPLVSLPSLSFLLDIFPPPVLLFLCVSFPLHSSLWLSFPLYSVSSFFSSFVSLCLFPFTILSLAFFPPLYSVSAFFSLFLLVSCIVPPYLYHLPNPLCLFFIYFSSLASSSVCLFYISLPLPLPLSAIFIFLFPCLFLCLPPYSMSLSLFSPPDGWAWKK